MADTEKITINLSVVDLGKIDLLVEQGFFSSRTDLIRTAIREKLAGYDDAVKKEVNTRSMGVGVFVIDRRELEELRKKGLQTEISVVGMAVIGKDVPAELARATIKSVRVFGVLRASKEVEQALADRIK
jgi:Arc/MetJ-type ribon-helix-helix transcriptional regulator